MCVLVLTLTLTLPIEVCCRTEPIGKSKSKVAQRGRQRDDTALRVPSVLRTSPQLSSNRQLALRASLLIPGASSFAVPRVPRSVFRVFIRAPKRERDEIFFPPSSHFYPIHAPFAHFSRAATYRVYGDEAACSTVAEWIPLPLSLSHSRCCDDEALSSVPSSSSPLVHSHRNIALFHFGCYTYTVVEKRRDGVVFSLSLSSSRSLSLSLSFAHRSLVPFTSCPCVWNSQATHLPLGSERENRG